MQKIFLFSLMMVFALALHAQTTVEKVKASSSYQCLPCGLDCDNIAYDGPGNCPHCQMPLVKKADVTFKSISPEAICSYINKHPGVVLLDVRTKEEFDGTMNPEFGTLKNAINIPIQQLEARVSELNGMKGKEIIVFCSHSHRSPQASYFLTQHGFKNVT